ncbi:hypothetical protein ECG_07708 [Echinococcus granulosus]|nr:hypothetical protein ECG_07708 [Echinococcus granulosus]
MSGEKVNSRWAFYVAERKRSHEEGAIKAYGPQRPMEIVNDVEVWTRTRIYRITMSGVTSRQHEMGAEIIPTRQIAIEDVPYFKEFCCPASWTSTRCIEVEIVFNSLGCTYDSRGSGRDNDRKC